MSYEFLRSSTAPCAVFDKRNFGHEIMRELIEIIQPGWPEDYIFRFEKVLPVPKRDISAEEVSRKLNQINLELSKICGIEPIKPFCLIDKKTTYRQVALYLIDLYINLRRAVLSEIPALEGEEPEIDFSMFHIFECEICLARFLRCIGCFLLSLDGLDFDAWLRFWESVGDVQSGDFHRKINEQKYAKGG